MSLSVVSTSSRSRPRRSLDVGAIVADLRREHGKQASRVLFELLSEDEAVARAVAVYVVEKLAHAPRRRVTPSAKERAEHQVAEKVAVTKLATRVKELVALDLPVTLLDGAEAPKVLPRPRA
jgi:hypothetical protein